MSKIDDQLYTLIATAEDQQKAAAAQAQAVQAKLEKLESWTEAFRAATRDIRDAAKAEAGNAARAELAGLAGHAASAVERAAQPAAADLHAAAKAAKDAASALEQGAAHIKLKLSITLAVLALGFTAAVGGGVYFAYEYQLKRVMELQAEIHALTAERDRMQAVVANLERRGGRLVVANCGGQMCIQAAANQRTRARWAAPWELPPNNQPAFIPARAPQ